MFDLVAKYKKWIMIAFFIVIIPPFALFGMESYFQDIARGSTVAKVGDFEITEAQFQDALRERRMRRTRP